MAGHLAGFKQAGESSEIDKQCKYLLFHVNFQVICVVPELAIIIVIYS